SLAKGPIESSGFSIATAACEAKLCNKATFIGEGPDPGGDFKAAQRLKLMWRADLKVDYGKRRRSLIQTSGTIRKWAIANLDPRNILNIIGSANQVKIGQKLIRRPCCLTSNEAVTTKHPLHEKITSLIPPVYCDAMALRLL